MKEEKDPMIYVMASEKMINMIFTIEQTLNFLSEYKVEPDEEVKKALMPIIDEIKKWLGN